MASVTPVPRIRVLSCPNCGGTVEIRGHAHTLSAVCAQCLSVLDTSTPELRILQRFEDREKFRSLIPLGARGKMDGVEWEVIGFQIRQIVVEDVPYRWNEFLLYNPYHGYRYLTEYQGHWNFIRGVRALPQRTTKHNREAYRLAGHTYAHFQAAQARTIYVMGEFPWRASVGESVAVNDYISPPFVLSSETTADEVVWSSGVYTPGTEIWRAFKVDGKPPRPKGVYANQPSPFTGRVFSMWLVFAILVGIFVAVCSTMALTGRGSEVFRSVYRFQSPVRGEPAFVTPEFDLKGGNVAVRVDTDLNNDWAFFSLALINPDTGTAYDFGREISYYSGRDSDGNWTEGGRSGSTTVPDVPPGRYYLRVEPDMDDTGMHRVNYQITVRQGVTGWFWLIVAFFLLPVPAIWRTWRYAHFEHLRWSESDYGSFIKTGDDE